ncbi:hypothetical protein V2G26_004189 [Clonostachys chloroleuca]
MQPVAGASAPKPLFFMEKLGRLVSLYRPKKILLLKNTTAEIYRPSRIGPAMKGAVPVVREVNSSGMLPSSPEALIHIFSNGGSGSIVNLYEQFAVSAGPGAHFPRHVTILDSSPSVYSVDHAVKFVSLSMSPLQRIVATPFLYIWAIGWSVLVVLGLVTTSGDWAKAHSNKTVETEARHVYIYSDTDVLIDDKGVESHAADAEAKGFSVRLERFEDSAHVAHARKDEHRYWDIVKKTWGGVA